METHAGEVSATLEELKARSLAELVDVYLTASPYRGEDPTVVPLEGLDPGQIVFFGGQNAAQLIAQFESLQGADPASRSYDAVIVLTDGTGYELGESDEQVTTPSFPVWVVHLGGNLPLGYDDGTLEAIQASGGGVAGSLEEALQRTAVSLSAGPADGSTTGPVVDLLDGYLWTVLPTDQAEAAIPAGATVQTHTSDDPFAALAARQLILAEMQRNRGTIDQAETLDALHALATNYGIVTPYSSMIVLVDWEQQALLDELSNLGDRYQREVEAIGETTPSTPLPLAGVPEPHEWLLIGLAVALLVYIGLKKRP
jgi:putative PEP-CTERM system integral membrane protein